MLHGQTNSLDKDIFYWSILERISILMKNWKKYSLNLLKFQNNKSNIVRNNQIDTKFNSYKYLLR